MAKYKRQKVKRYRRSFYSRGTRIKKGIGIVVLVLAVLGAAWLAAPHVLDWATHTWYTVVKNRDLEAESASRAAASSEAAASSAVQEAVSSQLEPEQRELVLLRFAQQLKLREIAQITGLPLRTVQSRLRAALKTLKMQLEKEDWR